jgi:type II secretory pathway pseudopilin PulG
MMLKKRGRKNKKSFTIVGLSIVVVVIGILAAITIVAYNGIQNRARAVTTKIGQALVITIAAPLRRATSLRLVLVLLVREHRFSLALAKAWRHIWGLLALIQHVSKSACRQARQPMAPIRPQV